MARTIGTANIQKVKALAHEAMAMGEAHPHEYVLSKISDEVLDSWEGAYSEVIRVSMDEYFRVQHG